MQIIITGHQIDLGDSLRSYAEKALETAVSKYFEEAVRADIHIAKEKSAFRTEITVHPATSVLIRAAGSSPDAYASFDAAAEKIARQLRKYKNKLADHKGASSELAHLSVIDAEEEKEEVGDAPVIIAEMETELPLCTVSAAVMRMDLAGLPALLFKNTAHGGLNMVYRRPDGNVGWVDPRNK